MTTVLYGKGKRYVDVTEKYKGYIPKSDQSRTTLFGGDPVVGVKKNVKIITDKCTEVYSVGQYKLPDKLEELHKKLVLNSRVYTDELDVQVMIALYLDKHHRVLYIGTDPTNTCIIASICNTVTVLRNTEDKLVMNITNGLEEYSEIETIEYIVQKYPKFDAVVVNCAVTFFNIVTDFPQILDDISILIVENNYKDHKEYVDRQLISREFIRIYYNISQTNYRSKYSHCYYEVWKKVDTMNVRSAGYNSNYKYSQVGDLIIRDRGLNIVYVDNSGSLTHKNFDTFTKNCTDDIIKFHTDLISRSVHYYIVVHDDATHMTDIKRLSKYFEQYGIVQFRYLKFRYAYYCAYYKGKVQERISDIDVKGVVRLGTDSSITICTIPWRYKYIEDYIESCSDLLHCNLLISNELHKHNYTDDQMYIFCLHPPHMLIQNTSDSRLHSVFNSITSKKKMLFNIEQMTAYRYIPYFMNHAKNGIRFMDYSRLNASILDQPVESVVPYQYNDCEVRRLKQYLNTEKKYDVAIVCTMGSRRQYIIDLLKAEGITVHRIEDWKEKRDEEIAKGRLLLNIHGLDDMLVWESMRCDRWIFAGLPVVSEISMDTPDLDIKDYIYWSTYDNIVQIVKRVLNDIHNGKVIIDIPSSIIENRRQQLYKFKNSL